MRISLKNAFLWFMMTMYHVSGSAQAEINVKFVNQSDYALRLKVGADSAVFGLATQPIIYSKIPADIEVRIEIEAILDNNTIDISEITRATNNTSSVFSTGKAAADLVNVSRAVAKEASILQKELLLRATYLKEINGSPFVEFGANIKLTENVVKAAKMAKITMGLGIANIGVSGVDWLLQKGKTKLILELTPSNIDGYKPGDELVIKISNNKIYYELRDPPEERRTFKCRIFTDSWRDIMCSYTDSEGDKISVKLDKNRFASGEIEIDENNSDIVIYEVIKHENSVPHYLLDLTKGSLNAGVAIVDPFIFTKILTIGFAINNFRTGVHGLIQRGLYSIKHRIDINKDSNVHMKDKNSFEVDINVSAK